jgi:MFS family permease
VQIGALTTARQLTAGTLNLPAGMLSDRLVRHRGLILASSLACMGVGYLCVGTSPGFYWVLPAAAFVGLGTALWHPAAAASLSNRVPERRATALAIHGMGATLSDTVTPIAVGALLAAFHWRNVLEVQILPGLLAAFLIWRGLAGMFAGGGTQPKRSAQLREIGELARNPVFVGLASSNGLMIMGRLVILTYLPIYLQEHLGYSPVVLGFYITLLHLMGTVAQPVLGFLSDQFGRKTVLLPSYLTLGALYLLITVAAPGIQLGLVVTAIGAFFYTLLNVSNAAVMDVARASSHGSSYGLAILVTQPFVLSAPMVAGFIVDTYGIIFAFLLSALFQLLAALVVAPLRLYRGVKAGT